MADISKITLPSGDTYNLKDSSAVHSISGTSPISVNGTAISHENSGVDAASKGDTANQTPTWGGTFKVPAGTVNATGHVTAFSDHTVKIPNTVATQIEAGLMSAEDKSKLDMITPFRMHEGVLQYYSGGLWIAVPLDGQPLSAGGDSGIPNGEGVSF